MNTKFESKEKFSVANMVADRIIAKALENNKLIWDIDWYSPCCNFEGRQYKGFNRLLLDPGIYITWTKLCEIGYTTKPGAKQHIVAFWKVYGSDTDTDTETDPDTAAEHKKKSFFLRYYRVFNIEDTTIPESEYPVFDRPAEPAIQDKTTEDILLGYMTKYGIGLREGGSAYYTPSDDIVTMPKRKYFKTNAGYYSTWAHECAHSTGIPSRLNRFQQAASFGDKEYSLEELVAEITAAMIGSACGYANEHTEDNSAAYVQSWAKVLKDNKSWIISAVSKAQKAFDMIINKPNEYDTKTEAIASVKQDRKPRMSDVKVTKPETEIVVEDAEELEICF